MMLTGSPLKPRGDLIQVIGLLVAAFGGLLGLLVGPAGGSLGCSSWKIENQAWLLLGNIGTEWNENLIELSQFRFFLSYKSFSSHQSKLENKQTIPEFLG